MQFNQKRIAIQSLNKIKKNMKKTLITLALATAFVSTGLSQGFVSWGNANNTRITTNSVLGGASTGNISANAGTVGTTYYFALFYSASATTVGGSSGSSSPVLGNAGIYAFSDASWTFLNPAGPYAGYTFGAAYATNTGTAGRYQPENFDPNQSATLVPFTSAAQFVEIGWSANIGTTWQQLQAYLANPAASGLGQGWVGESDVSGALTPGNPNASPPGLPTTIFGSTAGLINPFVLGLVPVPEPATLALAGLGGLSLLLFRRQRK
jgi:hypothetical protein